MTDRTLALKAQVARQVAHWQSAVTALDDLESFAAAAAWRSLERYLDVALRSHLASAVDRLRRQAGALRASLDAADTEVEVEQVRRAVVAFRRRYLQVETILDFYGDAVNSRTSPKLAGTLRACDLLARRSMEQVLVPLRRDVPPVLTYIDKGLGASILRAGLRLWEGGGLSPAAAVKLTRHNLTKPTSLLHEAGHQVAHLVDWNDELRAMMEGRLSRSSRLAAAAWSSWASELAADCFAFATTGYGSVAALADVLAGEERSVYALIPGDPHPVAVVRVAIGVQMARRFYGAGPWDDLAASWEATYPIDRAPAGVRAVLEASVALLPALVETCFHQPMRAFGGRPLVALVDPLRVSPDALRRLAAQAGPALHVSSHWVEQEGLRLLALSSLRAATEPQHAPGIVEELEAWMQRLGSIVHQAA